MFDVGGVLADDTYNVLLDTLFVQCEPWPSEEVRSLAQDVMRLARDQFALYKVDGDMGENRFWDGLLEEQGHAPVWDRIFEVSCAELVQGTLEEKREYLKELLRERCFRCFGPVIELARRLKSRHYLVGILSNHSREWYNEMSAQYGLDDLCTCREMACVSFQDDIRSGKPDAECFRAMIRRLCGVQAVRERLQLQDELDMAEQCERVASHVVFIDDKLRNVEAARDLGMRAIQFLYDKKRSNVDELIDKLEAMDVHARQ